MKSIVKDELLDVVRAYVNGPHVKPMLIWFHSNVDIDNVRRTLLEEKGCIRLLPPICDFVKSEDMRFMLYHFYFKQFDDATIKHCFYRKEKLGLPLVMLVNDYEKQPISTLRLMRNMTIRAFFGKHVLWLIFPYHVKHTMAFDKVKLPSNEYVDNMICEAILRRADIIVMHNKRAWLERIPELVDYDKLIMLKSPQNVCLSPNNMSEDKWNEIVERRRFVNKMTGKNTQS